MSRKAERLAFVIVLSAILAGAVVTWAQSGTVETEVRINARLNSERDLIEFALQQREASGDWSERVLPRSRFLPSGLRQDEWLVSTPVPLRVHVPADTGSESAQSESDKTATCLKLASATDDTAQASIMTQYALEFACAVGLHVSGGKVTPDAGQAAVIADRVQDAAEDIVREVLRVELITLQLEEDLPPGWHRYTRLFLTDDFGVSIEFVRWYSPGRYECEVLSHRQWPGRGVRHSFAVWHRVKSLGTNIISGNRINPGGTFNIDEEGWFKLIVEMNATNRTPTVFDMACRKIDG